MSRLLHCQCRGNPTPEGPGDSVEEKFTRLLTVAGEIAAILAPSKFNNCSINLDAAEFVRFRQVVEEMGGADTRCHETLDGEGRCLGPKDHLGSNHCTLGPRGMVSWTNFTPKGAKR